MAMQGTRPYFIRAIHDWIVDRQWTPYLLVNAEWPGTELPRAYVEDGRIVLNIGPNSVRHLQLGNDEIAFSARFGGQPMQVRVPIAAVLGIYARENGEGLFFDGDEYEPLSPVTDGAGGSGDEPGAKPRPALRVVK